MKIAKVLCALLLLAGGGSLLHAQDAVLPAPDRQAIGESTEGLLYAPQVPVRTTPLPPREGVLGLKGTYTIGATGDYASLRLAVNALNATVIDSTVQFLLIDAAYTDSVLNIGPLSYSAGVKPVIIKPAPGMSPVISLRGGAIAGFTFTGVSSITIDGSHDGSATRHLTVKMDTATGNPSGIAMTVRDGCNGVTIRNMTVKGYRVLGGTSTATNILTLSNASASTYNRNITWENLGVSGGFRAFIGGGYDSTSVDSNITIRDCTIGTTSSSRADSLTSHAVWLYNVEDVHIYENDISGTSRPANFGNSSVYGIFVLGSGVDIQANRVHHIKTNPKTGVNATYFAIGIGISGISGTSLNAHSMIANNMVHDILQGYSGTVYHWLNGIYTDFGAAEELYYNSVYLSGTSANAVNSAGLYQLRSTVQVVDNILYNGRTDASGYHAVAYWKNSTDVQSVITLSDYNDLFYSWGAGGAVGAVTTTYYGTLSGWTTATGQDGNSISADPQFNLSSPLHIRTDVPTPVEGRGTPVGILADYDGDPRNGLTPDIGADEGNFLPAVLMTYVSSTTSQNSAPVVAGATSQQIIGIEVVTTGTAAPISATQFDLSTDGTTAIGDISNARIYYTGTSAAFAATNLFGTVASPPAGAFSITGTQALLEGTNYFWVTYDISALAPEGNQVDAECASATVGGVARIPAVTDPAGARSIVTALAAGDYTVGLPPFNRATGRNLYHQRFVRRVLRPVPVETAAPGRKSRTPELAAASSAPQAVQMTEVEEEYRVLMENGAPYTGPMGDAKLGVYATITAAFADLNLRGVSGHVRFLLEDAAYPSETYPLTVNVTSPWTPAASATVTIKPAPGAAPAVTGGPASGPLLRVLGTSYITIDGSNTTGGTTRDLTLTSTTLTSPTVFHAGSVGATPITHITLKNCVLINGSQTSSAVVFSDATLGNAGFWADLRLENNSIQKAYMGLYAHGGTVPQGGANLTIVGNSLETTGANAIRYIGLYMQGVNGVTISGNRIGNFEKASGEIDRGMWLATGTINANVEANLIHDLGYTGTGGYGGKGIYVSSSQTPANIAISNNMITGITGDGDDYLAYHLYSPAGIFAFFPQTNVSIWNNSIHLYGNTLNYAGAMSSGIYCDSQTVADIRNNIVVNNLGLLAATGYGSACVFAQTEAALGGINYNNYYVNPAGSGVKAVGQIRTTASLTLGDWQTATGQEANSVYGDPLFATAGNLHIPSGPSPAANAGDPTQCPLYDYDGEMRDLSSCDIGADEFSWDLPQVAVPYIQGWNMISNPVTRGGFGDDSVMSLFGTSTFPYVFAFGTAGYTQTYTMPNGPGFWGKFASPGTQPVTGGLRYTDSIVVSAGWNMVGSVSDPVDTSGITSSPAGLRSSSAWFGYGPLGYYEATAIEPGKAYWVKCRAAGKFYFPARPLLPRRP
ncbi:MAG: BNR-repeat neuraminidase N-terminal domain-containing protein [Bacteroidota bacterium]